MPSVIDICNLALARLGDNATLGLQPSFDSSLQTAFMLVFFSSIGLSANFAKLREGGMGLIVFLVVVVVAEPLEMAVMSGLRFQVA